VPIFCQTKFCLKKIWRKKNITPLAFVLKKSVWETEDQLCLALLHDSFWVSMYVPLTCFQLLCLLFLWVYFCFQFIFVFLWVLFRFSPSHKSQYSINILSRPSFRGLQCDKPAGSSVPADLVDCCNRLVSVHYADVVGTGEKGDVWDCGLHDPLERE